MIQIQKSLLENSMQFVFLLLLFFAWGASAGPVPPQVPTRWTEFVQVEGQPEPVPAQWVSSPEGKLAHSIKLPKPLPKDSGYRKGMTSKEYFEHLCKTEAGEFIYKTANNVEGFYFARPPQGPTDDDLKERYKLEAPEIERTFQLIEATPEGRGKIFIGKPWKHFLFIEEPARNPNTGDQFIRSLGYEYNASPMKVESVSNLKSKYGMIWRGIKRNHDRELFIAGGEWIVFDLKTREVLAVQRNFGRTGFVKNIEGGVFWLNASSCSSLHPDAILPNRFYKLVSQSLRPIDGAGK